MGKIRNLGFVLVLIALVLVFVIIRTTDKNLFKTNTTAALEASKNGANLILFDDLKNKYAEYLLVDLSNADDFKAPLLENAVKIPFENLLDKTNLGILKQTDLKIVLFSEDVSTASKAWVILNQLNFKNVYILQPDKNEEVLKYKFQPDTSARLESD